MRDLLEKGYVYIAQPPLYKVKLGKQERYFKDEHERAQYMLTQALVAHPLCRRLGTNRRKIARAASNRLSVREAIVTRLSKTIDEQALAAFKRGVKVDLSSAQSAGRARSASRKRWR